MCLANLQLSQTYFKDKTNTVITNIHYNLQTDNRVQLWWVLPPDEVLKIFWPYCWLTYHLINCMFFQIVVLPSLLCSPCSPRCAGALMMIWGGPMNWSILPSSAWGGSSTATWDRLIRWVFCQNPFSCCFTLYFCVKAPHSDTLYCWSKVYSWAALYQSLSELEHWTHLVRISYHNKWQWELVASILRA